MKLVTNMRIAKLSKADAIKQTEFSEFLLEVGEGRYAVSKNVGDNKIRIPDEIAVHDNMDSLIDSTFKGIYDACVDMLSFSKCAILAPTNKIVQMINDNIIEKLDGVNAKFLGVDSVHYVGDASLYPLEFLHSINVSGIPPDVLNLKVGIVAMLLRNLRPSEGLCNGTRMIVSSKCH